MYGSENTNKLSAKRKPYNATHNERIFESHKGGKNLCRKTAFLLQGSAQLCVRRNQPLRRQRHKTIMIQQSFDISSQ
ncbi:hypothetical protein T265_12263 [Opisthorchis viverrini]|uniref:Uncharacterized protein n=1 Tax=Opisthorchis viverrini TaxID=6198 RepID=A0A074YUL3_OPIVI|nr:hypothetical protein T265_12263 [Opisthorchis viverrini]KER18476.1 hypothetical protein T265_12263 [Opisthorchis viverrini]